MAIYFHVDTNSAYLSWEAAYRVQHGIFPDLRDVASVVGGNQDMRHGIVLAKSNPAKKFNIKTGETLHSARIKCPELIVVPPRYELYLEASHALKELLDEYSPYVEQYSIDEMFLKYEGCDRECAVKTAHEISLRIKSELGFTVNIGIGENKLCAKMAGELEKPDKIITLWCDELPAKLWHLPVGELFMVGRATKKKLESRGITTIGALARLDAEYMHRWMKKPGVTIWQYANGIDNSKIDPTGAPLKNLSNSITMHFDVDTCEDCSRIILAISEMIGIRLRRNGFLCKKVGMSYKDEDFEYRAAERSLDNATACTNEVYDAAYDLFRKSWKGENIRQFGVSVGMFVSDDIRQTSMFGESRDKQERLNRCMDSIRERYGNNSIMYATFLNSGISPVLGGTVSEVDYIMMKSAL